MPNEYSKPPCPICDGQGHLDDVDGDPHGRTCRNCGESGERRTARVDPTPTIPPGLLRMLCGTILPIRPECMNCVRPVCPLLPRPAGK